MITDADVEQLAHLSRIECTQEERAVLKDRLNRVLGYIEQLNTVDTTGVTPCFSVLEKTGMALREDVVRPSLDREDFLAAAPHTGGMIRVPPVIHFTTP